MYIVYTASHQELLERWFLPNIDQDEFEIIIKKKDKLERVIAEILTLTNQLCTR